MELGIIKEKLLEIIPEFFLDWYRQRSKEYKEKTPSISIYVYYTSSVRKIEARDARDVVELSRGPSVYIKCKITNQGQTDLPLIKVADHTLRAPQLKPRDTYDFHIKTTPKSRTIDITAQNALNENYIASYKLVYYPTNNTTTANLERGFKKCKR